MKVEPWIEYESQRNNFNLDGSKNTNNQCMISSYAMLIRWVGRKYNINEFKEMSEHQWLAIIENTQLKKDGENRLFGPLHARQLNFMLHQKGIKAEVVRKHMTPYEIKEHIEKFKSPVIMGTWISEYLHGAKGHIMIAVGGDEDGVFAHDPYGKCYTNYKDHNGSNVFYSWDVMDKLITKDSVCAYVKEQK